MEITGNGTSANNSFNYYCLQLCPHRLPCGYCTKLKDMCPIQNSTTITWNSTTETQPGIKLGDITC